MAAFSYSYDGEGNIETAIHTSGTSDDHKTVYTYDQRNRRTLVTYKNNSDVVTKTVAYTYDVAGHMIGEMVTTYTAGVADPDKGADDIGLRVVLIPGPELLVKTGARLAAKPADTWPPGGKEAAAAQAGLAEKLGGKIVIENSIGMQLALIPPGEFLMGSPESELGESHKHERDEKQHKVRITKPFYLGVYPVTQEEYEKVIGKNPSAYSRTGSWPSRVVGRDTRRYPVESVSWHDAVAFCKKLSERENKTYRLPTEAEWEYACRAGTTTVFNFGDTLDGTQANTNGTYQKGKSLKGVSRGRPSEVGFYKPNAFGLYDMHGNVCQWCSDWHDGDYYSKSWVDDPEGPPKRALTPVFKVVRGGSFWGGAVYCRSAERDRSEPDIDVDFRGFRVVLVH